MASPAPNDAEDEIIALSVACEGKLGSVGEGSPPELLMPLVMIEVGCSGIVLLESLIPLPLLFPLRALMLAIRPCPLPFETETEPLALWPRDALLACRALTV